jgi:WD40-like Beta Propeller Repeat
MRISLPVLLLITLLMGILELRGQAPPAPRLNEVSAFRVVPLGEFPADPLYTAMSPDGSHLAVVATAGSRQTVYLDGVRQVLYDEIVLRVSADSIRNAAWMRFSSDGTRLVYVARRGPRFFVVVNGKEQGPYPKIRYLTIASTGNSYAYIADVPNPGRISQTLVFNGVVGSSYEVIPPELLRFSPDGKHIAYVAQDAAGRSSVVTESGAQPSPLERGYSEGLSSEPKELVQFSADGAHLAVVSSLRDKEQLLVDGKPGPYYDSIQQNTITQDGRHVAYIGWRSPSLTPRMSGNRDAQRVNRE